MLGGVLKLEWAERSVERLFSLRKDETRMRAAVSAVWIWTAVAVLHPFYQSVGKLYLAKLGFPSALMYVTCAFEFLLGVVVFLCKPTKQLVFFQALLVLCFSLILAASEPLLLANPFGVLSKNLQFLCILLVSYVVEKEGEFSEKTLSILRLGMACVWFTEGLFPKLLFQQQVELQMVPQLGITFVSPSVAVGCIGICQILSGCLALLLKGTPLRFVLSLQAAALLFLPLVVGFLVPYLWVHPFGPFSKNLPIFVGTLIVRKRCGGLS